MNAHWLNDGEQVLVTGTLDPEAAREWITEREPDMADFADNDPGYPHRGNIIPQNRDAIEAGGYRWMWYANANGRVRAVTFG